MNREAIQVTNSNWCSFVLIPSKCNKVGVTNIPAARLDYIIQFHNDQSVGVAHVSLQTAAAMTTAQFGLVGVAHVSLQIANITVSC